MNLVSMVCVETRSLEEDKAEDSFNVQVQPACSENPRGRPLKECNLNAGSSSNVGGSSEIETCAFLVYLW
jgi:hypothetical protein